MATRRLRWFGAVTGLLVLVFGFPLVTLAKFAFGSELYSYILLIPVICGYFVWIRRVQLESPRGAGWGAVVPFVVGLGLLTGYCLTYQAVPALSLEDSLALVIGAFYAFVIAGGWLTLGARALAQVAYPLGLLGLVVPLPSRWVDWLEIFLQNTSGWTAYAMLKLSGIPVVLAGLTLVMQPVPLQVARECSGIHSTVVLLITSLIAAYLFLHSPWRRAVLVVATIPLGILRNGFRIFTLGQLAVHYDPNVLNTWIHHRGGPIFFLFSLAGLYLVLRLLRRGEQRRTVAGG